MHFSRLIVVVTQLTLFFGSMQLASSQFLDSTTIGGYGNALYSHDGNLSTSTINLERFVLFVGHTFGSGISLFSELEIEDAKVSGGEPGGEVALEQAYVKFDVGTIEYFVAGLFIPRLGILNENHLPTSFNGNERTQVETFILPTTWRELGVGFYGTAGAVPLNYNVALVNGLNSAGFEHGSGIREGRFEGRNATADNLAFTGALQYTLSEITAQVSGYYGGTVGGEPRKADSLHLTSGMFGTPVIIGEADVRFSKNGFGLTLLGTFLSIPKAFDINRAYANNTPQSAYGAYIEASYDVLDNGGRANLRHCYLFGRLEALDMNNTIPSNGISDGTLRQQHIVLGARYLPVLNVALKADVRFLTTGEENPLLPVTPDPSAAPYQPDNTFLTLGIAFSF